MIRFADQTVEDGLDSPQADINKLDRKKQYVIFKTFLVSFDLAGKFDQYYR